jgi:uncharacterized protein (TIGR02284 family)
MARDTERDTLNRLIETCRDGARGFRLAADHVASPGLKKLFDDASRQRETFAEELVPFAAQLGGVAHTGTPAGTLHRAWMMVKDATTRYDEDAILAEAVRGEAAGNPCERSAGVLPPTARGLIEKLYATIRRATSTRGIGFADLRRNFHKSSWHN